MPRSSDEEYMPDDVEEGTSDLEVEFVPESPLRGSDIISASVGLHPSQRAGRPKFLAELDYNDDDEQVEQEYTGNWLSKDACWLSAGARTKVIVLPNGVQKKARCKRGEKYNDTFEKLIDEHYVASILCEMSAIVPHVPGEILPAEDQPRQPFQLDAEDENFAQETPSPVGSNEDENLAQETPSPVGSNEDENLAQETPSPVGSNENGEPIAGIDDQGKTPTVGGNEDGDPIAGPSHGSIHES